MTRTAIDNLQERWGLSFAEVAQALNVQPHTIHTARELRIEPEVNLWLEMLDTFLDALRQRGIEEPASWMAEPVVVGYTVTRWHLYPVMPKSELLLNAEGIRSDEELLTRHDLDWRRTYWTSFKTVEAADGGLSTIGKSYDDVLAQVRA